MMERVTFTQADTELARHMGARIGIIGAMQVEIDLLLERLEHDRITTVADMAIHEGTLSGVPVAIVRCGIGKVNAALCTQVLVNQSAPSHIINTGVAGALDTSLEIGDLVISTDAVQHDFHVTGLGYKPGMIPELGAGQSPISSFVADEQLAQIIQQAARSVAPTIKTVRGRIATGDQFVCTQEARERIIGDFGALCCEMEGAAIAQACWRNGIPFVIVRAISDKADDTSKVEYRFNEQQIAEHCAAIVAHAVAQLA